MNNFCAKCGTKLDKKDLVCPNCNKAARKRGNKNYFIIILIIVLICIAAYYSFNYIRHTYNKRDIENNIVDKLSDQNYRKIEIVSIDHCQHCNGSCDGSCLYYTPVLNCYRYSIKITFENEDIIETSATYTLSKKKSPDNDIFNYITAKNIASQYLHNSYYNIIFNSVPHIKYIGNLKDSLNLNFIQKLVTMVNYIYKQKNDMRILIDFEDGYTIDIEKNSYVMLENSNGRGSSIDTINKEKTSSNEEILKELESELQYINSN